MGQKELAVHPDVSFSVRQSRPELFLLDRFAEAEAILQRAAERKMQNPNQVLFRYEIAALKGNQGQMDRIAALAKGKQGAEYRVTHAEALSLARSGRLAAARVLSNRAVDLAMQAGDHETAASYRAARGVWEAVYGNAAEARSSATAALRLSKGRDLEYAVRPRTGFFRRLFSSRDARRRFREALPGRYICEIYLCAGSSCSGRFGEREARGHRAGAASDCSL